jgi:hypothetical protein
VETYDNKNSGIGKTLSVFAYTVNDGNSGNNYTVTLVTNTSGVINKAGLTITAQANTKTYDADITALTVPIASGLQGSDTVTGLVETYDNKNSGIGKTLSVFAYTVNDGNSGNNYTVTLVTNTAGVIIVKDLTVTGITANNKAYDGNTNATLNTTAAVLVGVVGAEDVNLNTTCAVGTFDNKNVGANKTVYISGLTIDGADISNYLLTQPTTIADITPFVPPKPPDPNHATYENQVIVNAVDKSISSPSFAQGARHERIQAVLSIYAHEFAKTMVPYPASSLKMVMDGQRMYIAY